MPPKCITNYLQNRYKELGRVSRAWRSLQEWKRHGCGHSKKSPGPGELTVQCPACPMPGVNLSADWMSNDDDKNLYTVQLAVDGNFSAVHQKQKNEDVWFNDGKGFLVEEAPYLQHLRSAAIIKEVLVPPSVSTFVHNEIFKKNTCHRHHAITDNVKRLGCDVTGVASVACLRNGFFLPNATVNFQEGEQYAGQALILCPLI